jgi:hypothetical protein
MKSLFSIFIVYGCLILPLSASESELRTVKWKEISNNGVITVYTPTAYNHKSGLVPIRFKTILNFDISRVLSVLADNSRKLEWVPRMTQARVLEKKSEADIVIYYKYNFPWPLADRDLIIRNLGAYDPVTKLVSVDMSSIEHLKDPALKEKDATRGRMIDGYSIITPLADNKTSVEMAILSDFGGSIPKWIINFIQKKWPYRFMGNLKKQLNQNDIKINPDFIFTK